MKESNYTFSGLSEDEEDIGCPCCGFTVKEQDAALVSGLLQEVLCTNCLAAITAFTIQEGINSQDPEHKEFREACLRVRHGMETLRKEFKLAFQNNKFNKENVVYH